MLPNAHIVKRIMGIIVPGRFVVIVMLSCIPKLVARGADNVKKLLTGAKAVRLLTAKHLAWFVIWKEVMNVLLLFAVMLLLVSIPIMLVDVGHAHHSLVDAWSVLMRNKIPYVHLVMLDCFYLGPFVVTKVRESILIKKEVVVLAMMLLLVVLLVILMEIKQSVLNVQRTTRFLELYAVTAMLASSLMALMVVRVVLMLFLVVNLATTIVTN